MLTDTLQRPPALQSRPLSNEPGDNSYFEIDPKVAWTFQQKIQGDPGFFMDNVLGGSPDWDGQRRIIESVRSNKKTHVSTGFGVGKTRTAGRLALWYLNAYTPSLVISTAPTWRQVKTQLWGEIRHAYKGSRLPLGGAIHDTDLFLDDDHFAIGLSTKDPEKFQGYHNPHILLIIDEASGVPDNIIDIALGLQYTRVLMIGNPSSSEGRFYECSRDPSWSRITINCWDTPNVIAGEEIIPGLVTRDWVEEKRRDWGEDNPLYISKVLGAFPQNTADALVSLYAIEACIAQDLPVREDAEYTLGVDVARFGNDETTFSLFKGAEQKEIIAYHGIDTMATVGYTREYKDRLGALLPDHKIGIDDTGVGGGVTDRLRELGLGITPVSFGGSARDKEYYVDCRSEMAIMLADDIKKKTIKLIDDKLQTAQLADLRSKMTSRGRKLEAKADMKKRIGRSPDRADATMIANYMRSTSSSCGLSVIDISDGEGDDE